jgi:hypothetical protein
MSPSTALRPLEDSPVRWRAVIGHDLVIILLAGAIAVALAQLLVTTPPKRTLTIVNGSDYELTVEAARPGDSSWTPVTIVDPRQSGRQARTIDQGDQWVFRFSGQGRSSGEVAISAEQLETDSWQFVVPPEVIAELENAGATPPPRSG